MSRSDYDAHAGLKSGHRASKQGLRPHHPSFPSRKEPKWGLYIVGLILASLAVGFIFQTASF